jgi:dTDP-4-amino-4,6-dideoxygalactose transaminase
MIRLASPDIQETDITRVNEVLKSGNLVQGQFVEAFEKKLVEFSKIDNCALVTSGTAALHLSLLALGIKAGDWIIVPAFTFPATANAVEIIGANVLLCDVDPTQYVVQPEEIEKVILKNPDKPIKAIIVVHEFGFPAQIKAIAEISKRYNLFLVEDSACALGTIADGYHTGYYSDLACFSFHPRKAITTGEGGAILSRN